MVGGRSSGRRTRSPAGSTSPKQGLTVGFACPSVPRPRGPPTTGPVTSSAPCLPVRGPKPVHRLVQYARSQRRHDSSGLPSSPRRSMVERAYPGCRIDCARLGCRPDLTFRAEALGSCLAQPRSHEATRYSPRCPCPGTEVSGRVSGFVTSPVVGDLDAPFVRCAGTEVLVLLGVRAETRVPAKGPPFPQATPGAVALVLVVPKHAVNSGHRSRAGLLTSAAPVPGSRRTEVRRLPGTWPPFPRTI